MSTQPEDDKAREAAAAAAAEEAVRNAPKPSVAEKRAAAEQSARQVARYSRERLLGPDGAVITGHPGSVIVGALHDNDDAEFTLTEINRKIESFLGHEDTTGQEA